MIRFAELPGLSVGHATDVERRTGTTAIVFDKPVVAGVEVRGGAPGTRETDTLRPGHLNPPVDAIILSGGSAFGLAAADGAQEELAKAGRGYAVGSHKVPIVPAAILFDLSADRADYRELGRAAVRSALKASDRALGSVGAGTGATTARLRGGLGSAVEEVGGIKVGAIVAVNALGQVTAHNAPNFRAAPFERGAEFGGMGIGNGTDYATAITKRDTAARQNTVIAAVVTDAVLDAPGAARLASVAHDGIALSVFPAHTLFDGDTVFAASTGHVPVPEGPSGIIAVHAAAVRALARAIAIGVYVARSLPGDRLPSWQSLYGSASG